MPSKLLRKLLLAPVVLWLLFEIVCWIFFPFPQETLRKLELDNDIPGFKKNVQIFFGDDQVRYLEWTGGAKPPGSVRLFFVGGFATLGMLQSADDTWWGQVHGLLKAKGLKVETAAKGLDRTTVLEMTAAVEPLVGRLKPDVIILNAGFDDVTVHSAEYTYDENKLASLPRAVPPSAFRKFLLKVSQTVRFRRWWNKDSEAKQMQNQLGRKNVYKKYFEDRKKQIAELPPHPGIPRSAGVNDPVREYLDGLKAMKELAAAAGATLIITGEAALHDSVISHTAESNLLAYLTLKKPEADGNAPAARPDPGWVMREMERFSSKAETFALENKLPWIDLNGRVPRTMDYFFTDVLLTDAGAAEAARAVLPVVEPVVREKSK